MRIVVPFCALLASAAVFVPLDLGAQEQLSVPASKRGPVPGFGYTWETGLSRGTSGQWEASDYPKVTGVTEGSPAARAGLRSGDVIVSVDGRDGRRPPLFRQIRPGSVIKMRVRRGEEEREITFQISNHAPESSGG